MSAGLPLNDPAVNSRDISISAGDVSCQQKAEGRMRRIQRERLSEYFKFSRVTEGGGAPVRGRASVRIFVQLHAAFYSSPLAVHVRPPLHLFPSADACPAGSDAPSVYPLLFSPAHFQFVCLDSQPCRRLPSPPTTSTSTSRRLPTTRSTAASRGPRSSWRSATAIAWRG